MAPKKDSSRLIKSDKNKTNSTMEGVNGLKCESEGNLVCNDCGKVYKKRGSFEKHLKFHTSVKKSQNNKNEKQKSRGKGRPKRCNLNLKTKYTDQEVEGEITSEEHSSSSGSSKRLRVRPMRQSARTNILLEENDDSSVSVSGSDNEMENDDDDEDFQCGNDPDFRGEEGEEGENKMKSKDKSKNLECHICNRHFSRPENLNTHMFRHTGEKPFPCHLCSKSFARKYHLNVHIKRHTNPKIYACDKCGESFKREDHLKYHRINNHEGTIYLNELKIFNKTRKTKLEKTILCEICGKGFIDHNRLKVHKKIHTENKKYQCQFCEKYFSNSSNFNVHIRLHTGNNPYKCVVCGDCFRTSSRLKTHTRKHTGEYPFVCEVCGKICGEKHLLKVHMQTHSEQKMHECSHCGKTFAHSSTLRAHVRLHTGSKPFVCQLCGHSFAQVSSLNYHKRTHTGEKPFTCHICGNSYTRKTTLTTHLMRHSGTKLVTCSLCDFTCYTAKQRKKHLSTEHNVTSGGTKLQIQSTDKAKSKKDKCLQQQQTILDNKGINTAMALSSTFVSSACETTDFHLSNEPYSSSDQYFSISKNQPNKTSSEVCFKTDVNQRVYDNHHLHLPLEQSPYPQPVTVTLEQFTDNPPSVIHHTVDSTYNNSQQLQDQQNETTHLLNLSSSSSSVTAPVPSFQSIDNSSSSHNYSSHPNTSYTASNTFPNDNSALPVNDNSMVYSQKPSSSSSTFLPQSYNSLPSGIGKSNSGPHPHVMGNSFSYQVPSPYAGTSITPIVPGRSVESIGQNLNESNNSNTNTNTSKNKVNIWETIGTSSHPSHSHRNASSEFHPVSNLMDDKGFHIIPIVPTSTQPQLPAPPQRPLPSLECQPPKSANSVIPNDNGSKVGMHTSATATSSCPSDGDQQGSYCIENHRDGAITDGIVENSQPETESLIKINSCQDSNIADNNTNDNAESVVRSEMTAVTEQTDLHISVSDMSYSLKQNGNINNTDNHNSSSLVSSIPNLSSFGNDFENEKAKSIIKDECKSPPSPLNNGEPDDDEILNIIAKKKPNYKAVRAKSKVNSLQVESDKSEVSLVFGKKETRNMRLHVSLKLKHTDPNSHVKYKRQLRSDLKSKNETKFKSRKDVSKLIKTVSKNVKVMKKSKAKERNKLEGEKAVHPKRGRRPHNKEKLFNCSKCDIDFAKSGDLNKHIVSTHKKPQRVICLFCLQTYETKSAMVEHIVMEHEGQKPFSCNACSDFSSFDVTELKQHIKTLHCDIEYKCDICHKPFSKSKYLKDHMMKNHKQSLAFTCRMCDKSFAECSLLVLHNKHKHSGLKPYKCNLCSKLFVAAAKLQTHLRVHTGDKPYTCEFCGKVFAHLSLLSIHMKAHSSVKPFVCDYCSQSFTHKSTLTAHVRTHTGVKPFQCDLCPKSFAQLSSLNYHKKSHDGLKPFTCELCGKSFTRATTLKTHLMQHAGKTRFSCELCEFKCNRKHALRKHHNKKHSGGVSQEKNVKSASTGIGIDLTTTSHNEAASLPLPPPPPSEVTPLSNHENMHQINDVFSIPQHMHEADVLIPSSTSITTLTPYMIQLPVTASSTSDPIPQAQHLQQLQQQTHLEPQQQQCIKSSDTPKDLVVLSSVSSHSQTLDPQIQISSFFYNHHHHHHHLRQQQSQQQQQQQQQLQQLQLPVETSVPPPQAVLQLQQEHQQQQAGTGTVSMTMLNQPTVPPPIPMHSYQICLQTPHHPYHQQPE